jgi:hypothetical protein
MNMIFNNLRIGQRVKFLIPNGFGRNGQEWKEKSGRVTLAFPDRVVVNGGGKYGTPYVVTERNFVG